MTAALYALIAALVAVLGAAGTITWLALRAGDLKGRIAELQVDLAAARVDLAAEHRERGVAIARAERYLADLDDQRRRAQVEIANLRADLEELRDAPHVLDPATRRDRWAKLLARADAAAAAVGTPGADPVPGADLLRGVDGQPPGAAAAGGGADRPGAGRTPA